MNGERAEILWDSDDVPHIFSGDEAGLFYAMGWAQMRNHGNLVLRLYAQARARAAELWGARYLTSDRWVATMGIPERAAVWLGAQSPEFRGYLDAFAAGLNDYARVHGNRLGNEALAVLPVTAADVLAHAQRVVNFSFVVDPDTVLNGVRTGRRFGSNAWAVGPSRSSSGCAMLLTNPHLPWGDPWGEMFVCFEAHLNAPGVHLYGMALVGFPVLAMAFNDRLGWSHTVNTYNGWTRYELDLAGGGYRFDGSVRAFEIERKTLRMRGAGSAIEEIPLVVRRSVHGPVIEVGGTTIAVRVAGLEQPAALEQWWRMGRAQDVVEFEAALALMQIPMFSVLYADRDGHIKHFFNGQVPVRSHGDAAYWAGSVPGNSSANVWTRTHAYEDLPLVADPPSGWLQNANDPPWTTTFPPALDADDFPPYLSPRGPMSLRAQRSARMLMQREHFSFEDLVRLKFSTLMELAERVREELLRAAYAGGAAARAAADVLRAWDGRADADSRGGVLFVAWVRALGVEAMFAVPWDERDPLSTPRGLADPAAAVAALEHAAAEVERLYGALDVAWGDVFRLDAKGTSVPAIGADELGAFTELWFVPGRQNRFSAVGGECYIAVVEFSNPVRAMVLNTCGNASEPVSAHPGKQLEAFSRKQLRTARLTRSEVERDVALHEIVPVRSGMSYVVPPSAVSAASIEP